MTDLPMPHYYHLRMAIELMSPHLNEGVRLDTLKDVKRKPGYWQHVINVARELAKHYPLPVEVDPLVAVYIEHSAAIATAIRALKERFL